MVEGLTETQAEDLAEITIRPHFGTVQFQWASGNDVEEGGFVLLYWEAATARAIAKRLTDAADMVS